MIDATKPEMNASAVAAARRSPAGQRLRELYTQECVWRSGELGPMTIPDADEVISFLPRVDETAQLARRERWERTLAEAWRSEERRVGNEGRWRGWAGLYCRQ